MSIQQNINQTLSLASFVMGQTPMAATQREEALRKGEIKRINRSIPASAELDRKVGEGEPDRVVTETAAASTSLQTGKPIPGRKDETDTTKLAHLKMGEEEGTRREELARKRFELDPTEENYRLARDFTEQSYLLHGMAKAGRQAYEKRMAPKKRADADRAAATQLENQRRSGPLARIGEMVSNLWHRGGKK